MKIKEFIHSLLDQFQFKIRPSTPLNKYSKMKMDRLLNKMKRNSDDKNRDISAI